MTSADTEPLDPTLTQEERDLCEAYATAHGYQRPAESDQITGPARRNDRGRVILRVFAHLDPTEPEQ